MNCKRKKEELIEYFYDDIDLGQKLEIEQHILHCAECQAILDEFAVTRSLLQAWPEEQPKLRLSFMEEKTSILDRLRPGNGWRHLGMALTTGLVATLVILSLMNFEVSYSQGDFAVRMSIWPDKQASGYQISPRLTEPVSREEFDLWQLKSLRLMQQLIKAGQEHQHREMEMKLAHYTQELDAKRLDDLRLVGEGLEVVRLSNENRFRQTTEAIQELIQMARPQDPAEPTKQLRNN